ncbi:MAG: hypothetical protein MRQ09_04570 [Candidatus Midichloria sp.]|nr:hypothetical protein [Candidatus Midichloria sp.]
MKSYQELLIIISNPAASISGNEELGLAVRFIAGAFKHLKSSQQEQRIKQLIKIALSTSEGIRHLGHYTASTLAKNYAAQNCPS